jgi:hypothetical protein
MLLLLCFIVPSAQHCLYTYAIDQLIVYGYEKLAQ